jgi:uncharacterized membrane protein YfhO
MYTKTSLMKIRLQELKKLAAEHKVNSDCLKPQLVDRLLPVLNKKSPKSTNTKTKTPSVSSDTGKISIIIKKVYTPEEIQSNRWRLQGNIPQKNEVYAVYEGTYKGNPFRTRIVKYKKDSPIVVTTYQYTEKYGDDNEYESRTTMSVSLIVLKNKAISMNHIGGYVQKADDAYDICCEIHKRYVNEATNPEVYKNDEDKRIAETAFE